MVERKDKWIKNIKRLDSNTNSVAEPPRVSDNCGIIMLVQVISYGSCEMSS